MSQVRHVLESGNKSNPSSPQELHDGQQQLPSQTTGITSRPQAARSPFEWINVKKTSSSQGLMQGQTYSSSQPPPGMTAFCRESLFLQRYRMKLFNKLLNIHLSIVLFLSQAKLEPETSIELSTLIIKGWNWKKNFASVNTLRFERKVSWLLNWVCLRDRSRFGSKIEGQRTGRSRRSMKRNPRLKTPHVRSSLIPH